MSESKGYYIPFWGNLKAAVGVGKSLAFVTVHPEGLATAIYRNFHEGDKSKWASSPLPCGGLALIADGEALWVGGTDGHVFRGSVNEGTPTPLGSTFPTPPTAFALLADDRLAVLVGSKVAILKRSNGKVVQTLDLDEPGTSLAADPTGRWLVAGTAKGTVAVFEAENRSDFDPSTSERIHEGAVTALLFEPDELRFFSAGADLKLLSTHARGKLEPEDKGRGNNHSDIITALIWGPGDRLYSGSRDATIKSWPRTGAIKPATTKDGVGKVVALAIMEIQERPHLAVARDDNQLKVFAIDEAGKVGDEKFWAADAYSFARSILAGDDPNRREERLRTLAKFVDNQSIEMIAAQVGKDPDHGLRLLAAQLLGDSKHPRAAKLLEPWLKHADEAVRGAAFQGLRKRLGDRDLGPLDLALKADKADVGRLAVEALETLAAKDDQALSRLLDALNAKTWEVRQAALTSLEHVHDPKSPEADLIGLASRHPDIRRLALVRLYQRKFLQDSAVQSALRRRAEDDDPEVRRTAFLLALLTREKLLEALRARDPELQRQLSELEGPETKAGSSDSALGRVVSQIRKLADRPTKSKGGGPGLDDADYEPLLQATASRALDTSLRGARGLALLEDPRAFGLLLQLSREDDTRARVEVCRAMAALDDARGIKRLRSLLHDQEAEVRDAAFSALAEIHQADPLLAAESGLNAGFEDVRRRGLQALIASVRKAPPKGPDSPSWQLLARALNDSVDSVRSEAFKAALNLNVGGGGPETLRFVQRSIHADIRREVLTEVMAQVDQPWVWDLLLEFFNDPDPKLRDDAFAFATKKTKGLEFLDAALGSRYPDLRRQAVDALVKKQTKAAQALLVKALDDEDRKVRLAALESLVGSDARTALTEALKSPHADVRLRAAKALARHGDPAALAPLLALATAPEPTEAERQKVWAGLVESALDGLGELGAPEALTSIIPRLDSPVEKIRKQAGRALAWVARPETHAALREALRHDDPQVKYHAALGLAYAGDASVASLVFSDQGRQVLSVGERIAGAFTLGSSGEDQLVVFLDDSNEQARTRALLLLIFLEWKASQGSAARSLACLSSRMPRVRLTAAQALECLADPAAFRQFVVDLVNDRGESPAWKIPAEDVDTLAELLVYATPLIRARTSRLLRLLHEKEQAAWGLAWSAHQERFAGEIAAVRALSRPAVPLQFGRAELEELAFGAYVGLVREQGQGSRGPEPHVIRVRQTALSRILALAKKDPHHARAARPVFIQALGDPNQAVRLQAFEHLQALGIDAATLGAEALATGQTDLGVKGLEILTSGASAAEAQAVLERAMLSRKDGLAVEAAKLLIARRGAVAVAGQAIEAAHEPLRIQAVAWLAAEADAGREPLRKALGSRYQRVREASALELAGKKDPIAFDALVELLKTAHLPVPQRRFIQALVTLGDPRAPSAFVDRLETDPGGTALPEDLLRAAGSFRRPEGADRIIKLMEKEPKWRPHAFNAALTISGHDQKIEDPEEERPDDRWEEKQFPRHDDVLARLIDRVAAIGDARLLSRLVPSARWARGKSVEPGLATQASHPDEALRRAAIEAIGWRLRKREGNADPLIRALQHKDPISQFLAAEGLARAGRADGLNVLLASIDFVSDLSLRRRAVRALGELADARVLDPLLKLANEDGHALQDEAAEAIGHLGRSAKSDEIFKILERHARGFGSLAENALKGLRWLNTEAGWRLIRQRVGDPTFPRRWNVAELLGDHDDTATRDLLLRLLAEESNGNILFALLKSARRLWGRESLEPDDALLQNRSASILGVGLDEPIRRVSERGEARRVFVILAKAIDPVREALTISLLGRSPLPVAEAASALASPDDRTVQLAAQILGRAGAAPAETGAAIETALAKWWDAWEVGRRRLASGQDRDNRLDARLTPCLRTLVWTAGRLRVAKGSVLKLATTRDDDPHFRPIRLEAVSALASGDLTPEVVATLKSAALGNDPEVRALAAQTLGLQEVEPIDSMAEQLLSDEVSFNRLARHEASRLGETLRSASRKVHYQGVALPHLVERGDVGGLAAVAEDRALPDSTRLGAIEGLATLALDEAEDHLRRIGQAEENDEDLRKAAWRGLRRSKRARKTALAAGAKS